MSAASPTTESTPNFPPPWQWEADRLGHLQFVQRKGVCYMTNGEESSLTADIPQSARLWVIANYLLVKNNCTYMYMSGFTAGGQYGSLIIFPEYSIPIGHATSAMEEVAGHLGTQLFRRLGVGESVLRNIDHYFAGEALC